jgi:hypothetical protein
VVVRAWGFGEPVAGLKIGQRMKMGERTAT